MADRPKASGGSKSKAKDVAAAVTSPITLIHSEDTAPLVRLTPGLDVRIETVRVAGHDLAEELKDIVGGSSLCGGSGTCLAIVDTSSWRVNPPPDRA